VEDVADQRDGRAPHALAPDGLLAGSLDDRGDLDVAIDFLIDALQLARGFDRAQVLPQTVERHSLSLQGN
jgi:hypothetical protein